MTPLLHPALINGRTGDPALYVDVQFQRRALLFDLGDLHILAPRKIHRLDAIFVSHAHIDHFIGFDLCLRVWLGREKTIRLCGPAGITQHVTSKLGGYSWNLVGRYSTEIVFEVLEALSGAQGQLTEFHLTDGFTAHDRGTIALKDGCVFADDMVAVHAAVLDHRIPCLAYAVTEKAHVNVHRNRLEEIGLVVGPWLSELKSALAADRPDDTPITVARQPGRPGAATLALGQLRQDVVHVTAGQKIGYVVDSAYNPRNAERIIDLVRDADTLFIETAFLEEDADLGRDRFHLTARQAGVLAARAGVRRLEPFHLSARYEGREDELLDEAQAAFDAEKDLHRL